MEGALSDLNEVVGRVDLRSAIFAFDHTHYYEKEMGPGLSKQFVSFRHLHRRDLLVELKLKCMEAEEMQMKPTGRALNLDPAYMELPKLVVASHKNFAHRIYLSRGVFGDVQLVYRDSGFIANEWTYPDYKSEAAITFFESARKVYAKQLEACE